MWTSNLAAKKLRIKSSLRKNNLIILRHFQRQSHSIMREQICQN
jgi:hypothetical protein